MIRTQTRIFTWLSAPLALSAALTACGSTTPQRAAALDPSNPNAPESPRMAVLSDAPADSEMSMDMSSGADAMPMPMQHGQHHHGAMMDMAAGGAPPSGTSSDGATVYTCPMHPEVTSSQPGHCPKCGMTLVPKAKSESSPPPAAAHQHGSLPQNTGKATK